MIGPMSSSLALAQRTATKASATMDTMARQIATGQRVSSVKDDGAAWTRAAGIKSEVVRHQTVADWGKRAQAVQEVSFLAAQAFGEQVERGRELVIAAIGAQQSGSSRKEIQAEHAAVAAGMNTLAPNSTVDSLNYLAAHVYSPSLTPIPLQNAGPPYIWAIQPFGADPEYDDLFIQLETYTGVWPINTFESYDLATADAATLAGYKTTYETWYTNWMRHQTQALGIVTNSNDRIIDRAEKKADRLTLASNNLTDADLGKVSATRAQADTRQQLALSTIQQAISAYGNFASGLLGNVQRTQRGLLA